MTKEKNPNRIKCSYKVEVYGEQVVHSGEVFDNLVTRDIYKDEILARKSIARIVAAPSRGSKIVLSIKENKGTWEHLETIKIENHE